MSERARTLLADRRARVPFALIGIFLLLLSSMFVVQMETRDNSTPSLETDRAIEQTDAAARTALTVALTEASEQASIEPMTEAADTEYGLVLDEKRSSSTDADVFDRYLKALVYLNAKEQFETAGQQVGSVETELQLPEISDPDDFEAAVDSVTVRPGIDHQNIESGVVEAQLENITVVATRDGEKLAQENKTVTVAVVTPLYELHDRTERFQDRLDAGVSESGFSQRFNARVYALGWARGYAQYGGAPVTEVIANRHIVPAANDAIYRTQKDVFDTADSQLNNAIRRGWLCMAFQDAEGLYNGFSGEDATFAEDLCEQSEWLFGDQATGELPDAPGTMDLLGNAPGMDTEQTIGVNRTAYLPLREMVSGTGEHSFARAIDRIFEIEAAVDHSVETVSEPSFDHDPPRSYAMGRSSVVETTNQRTTVDIHDLSEPAEDEQYYEIEGQVRLRLEQTKEHAYRDSEGRHETKTSAIGTRELSFEITFEEKEISPNANIDSYNHAAGEPTPIAESYTYQPGPERSESSEVPTIPDGRSSAGFENYVDVEDAVLRAYFSGEQTDQPDEDGRITVDDIETTLANTWNTAVTGDDLTLPASKTVSLDPPSPSALERALTEDISAIQDEASEITHQFERRDILHDGSGRGPYGELVEKVDREKQSYIDREKPYASVGQKAVYEARYSYFERLESELARYDSAHGSAMGKLDEKLPDTGLDRVLTYLQQGVTATPPDPVPLESSSLTEDVSYEISGSPTYLVTENVTTEEVPPVGNTVDAFAPMAVRNENHLNIPYDSVVEGLIDRFSDLLGLGGPDAELTFQISSEALQAGQLATEAATDDEYGDETTLGRLTGEFEESVEDAILEYQRELASQIAFNLYPDDIVDACTSTECTEHEKYVIESEYGESANCSRHGCEYDFEIPEECSELLCAFEEDSVGHKALPEIEQAVEKTVSESGADTAEIAGAIDSKVLNEAIAAAVFQRLDDSQYRPAYADKFGSEQWQSIIESGTQPAATTAANEQTVTLSDTDIVEELDGRIRETLENVTTDMTRDRFEEHLGGEAFEPDKYDDWVDGHNSPLRVPAGMPLLPVGNLWFATVNLWDIEVEGEYARFEASANVGSAGSTSGMNYVREDKPVEREIAGEKRQLGTTEPIAFSGRSALVVAVPPGGLGVGDRNNEDPECSPTWPIVGDLSGERIQCSTEQTENSTGSVDMQVGVPAVGSGGAVGSGEIPREDVDEGRVNHAGSTVREAALWR